MSSGEEAPRTEKVERETVERVEREEEQEKKDISEYLVFHCTLVLSASDFQSRPS